MRQRIAHVALVVKDYDEAVAFYTRKLRFTVVEDTYQPAQDKRWVVIAPPGAIGPDGGYAGAIPVNTSSPMARAPVATK